MRQADVNADAVRDTQRLSALRGMLIWADSVRQNVFGMKRNADRSIQNREWVGGNGLRRHSHL